MRRFLALFFLLLPAMVLAQATMEIIPLQYRTVEQVLPVLRPLVEPGGTLSGMSGQIIVRTSRRNLDELRQAIAAIDRPARRLVIHVSQNRDSESRDTSAGMSGDVGFGDNVRIIQPDARQTGSSRIEIQRGDSVVNIQGNSTQRSGTTRSSQSVQVIEGGQAAIQVGRSLPLPMRQLVRTSAGVEVHQSVVYRDIGQGFYAVPRLAGDRVTLEISPQFDTQGQAGYGSVNTQRLVTTVSGRLGEWIELGGSVQQSDSSERRLGGREAGERRDAQSVWLRVEELP